MKLDIGISTRDLSEVPAEAKRAEQLGFDALWSMEAGNDALLPLALAAEHTRRIKLGPSVAIAFPRSPMAIAYTAWDLAALSQGRFILGLGTQVKGHIERRYGVKWEPPVPKLREYIQALRTIFKSWEEGGKKHTGKSSKGAGGHGAAQRVHGDVDPQEACHVGIRSDCSQASADLRPAHDHPREED